MLNIADVTIEEQDLVFISKRNYTSGLDGNNIFTVINPRIHTWEEGYTFQFDCMPWDIVIADRFTIKVTPHDGTAPTYIIKSFLLDHKIERIY